MTLRYPNISSATGSIPRREVLPFLEPEDVFALKSKIEHDEEVCDISEPLTSKDSDFIHNVMPVKPCNIAQNELNDLIRSLKLQDSKTKLLGSTI
jgi:hypothetical protein